MRMWHLFNVVVLWSDVTYLRMWNNFSSMELPFSKNIHRLRLSKLLLSVFNIQHTHSSFAIKVLKRKHQLCKILQRVTNEMKFSMKFYNEMILILIFVLKCIHKCDFLWYELHFTFKIRNFFLKFWKIIFIIFSSFAGNNLSVNVQFCYEAKRKQKHEEKHK